jgi:phosphopantothenoylcysteine decarboxylase/phosphopantothenate--cysteine ligase
MNPQMWEHPVTQKNYTSLKKLGYHMVDPVEGEMACDHVGVGRMAEPDVIFEAAKKLLGGRQKKKRKKD